MSTYEAMHLVARHEDRGGIIATRFEPSFPKDGGELDKLRWHAGQTELVLGCFIEIVVEDGYDFRLSRTDTRSGRVGFSWSSRRYGNFSYEAAAAYLRGLRDGHEGLGGLV